MHKVNNKLLQYSLILTYMIINGTIIIYDSYLAVIFSVHQNMETFS